MEEIFYKMNETSIQQYPTSRTILDNNPFNYIHQDINSDQ